MNNKTQEEINVGIDTSQSQLDIYVRPTGDYFSVENTPEGAKQAARRIQKYQPTRVLIEATGRLELNFVCAAQNTGLTVVVCNAGPVMQFAGPLADWRKRISWMRRVLPISVKPCSRYSQSSSQISCEISVT
ncbi:MAG: transposase [Halioglobus sp.]|jgi:transposase